jgi:hypothetical protein
MWQLVGAPGNGHTYTFKNEAGKEVKVKREQVFGSAAAHKGKWFKLVQSSYFLVG